MDTDDIAYYASSFEKSFRIFYNAIKSNNANAKVYYSVDHEWNSNMGKNEKFFNAREVVYAFNDAARLHGNYDWGLAIHPYPNPLTKVRFWDDDIDKSADAAIITPMNLSVVTDMLAEDEMLDTSENVRNIAITEFGITSTHGEKLQAAAFAYCYYIIENNEYIDSFLLNRQIDSLEEIRTGMALGLYKTNRTPKLIAEVYANVDLPSGLDYIDEMLEILGADSMEEALEWAK